MTCRVARGRTIATAPKRVNTIVKKLVSIRQYRCKNRALRQVQISTAPKQSAPIHISPHSFCIRTADKSNRHNCLHWPEILHEEHWASEAKARHPIHRSWSSSIASSYDPRPINDAKGPGKKCLNARSKSSSLSCELHAHGAC